MKRLKVFIECGNCSNPVSYTHLDVYKRQRLFGEIARHQQHSYLTSTIGNLKRLLGVRPREENFATELEFVKDLELQTADELMVRIDKKGSYTATQLMAMILNKLKTYSKCEVDKICFSVPQWYDSYGRRAALEACQIANFKEIKIVNELTSAATWYAHSRPVVCPTIVCFIDIGYTSFQVAIAEVKPRSISILGSASNRNFGGRNIDYAIAEIFREKFRKEKTDIAKAGKDYFKLVKAVEKLKEILSVNNEASVTIEVNLGGSNIEEKELHLTRKDLEDIVEQQCRVSQLITGTIEAVSYTHLDVYKRQSMSCTDKSWKSWKPQNQFSIKSHSNVAQLLQPP